MKKTLLVAATLLVCGTAMANVRVARPATLPPRETRGDAAEMVFRYNDVPEEAFNVPEATPGTSMVYGVVKFRHEDLARFVGNSITSVVYTSGAYTDNYVSPISKLEVFITKDLNEEPLILQSASDLPDYVFYDNVITLDEPYEITADDDVLYFGVRMLAPEGKTACYLASDLTNSCATNQIIGVSNDGSWPQEWMEEGLEHGSLCIGLGISGECLPENALTIVNSVFPSYVKTGETGTYTLFLRNLGTNLINDYTVSTKIGDSEPFVQKMEPQWPIRSMSTVRHQIPDVPFNGEGFMPVEISITEVNGVTVENPIVFNSEALAYESGFQRNVLVEEFGGPTCGWCPAGYVLMEYAAETYPGRIIAVNGQVNTDDQCPDYQEFIDNNVPSIPYTWINRVSSEIPANVGEGAAYTYRVVDNIFEKYDAYPSYCNVGVVSAVKKDASNEVEVTAEAEFSIALDCPHRFAFILTEDNVGPANQLNNYSGGMFGDMAGWENMDGTVEYYYDDVIRACVDVDGIAGSCPESISKGEKVTCSASIPLDNVNDGDLKVVAMVINAKTGEVMNATRVDVTAQGVDPENTIDVQISDVTNMDAHLVLTPSDPEMRYYMDVATAASVEDHGGIDNIPNALIIDWWKWLADMYSMDWTELIPLQTVTGSIDSNLSELIEEGKLSHIYWGQDYIFYAVGFDLEGNVISNIANAAFSTPAPEKDSDLTFEFVPVSFKKNENYEKYYDAVFNVIPSNNDEEYFTEYCKTRILDQYEDGSLDREYTEDEIIIDQFMDYAQFHQGSCTVNMPNLEFADSRGSVNYYIIAVGWNEGPTTSIQKYEFNFDTEIPGGIRVEKSDKPFVTAMNGCIEIHGIYDAAAVFSTSGQHIGSLRPGRSLSVEPGVYVVHYLYDGVKHTTKVMVK